MNRECMGLIFNANDTTYYRCLYNGEICTPAPAEGEICPLCERQTSMIDKAYISRVRIETEAMGSIKIKDLPHPR